MHSERDLLKIGFYSSNNTRGWYGGISYLKQLLFSLKSLNKEKIKIYAIDSVSKNILADELKPLIDGNIPVPPLRIGTFAWIRDNIERRVAYRGKREEDALNDNGINAVFDHLLIKKFRKIPVIPWFGDLQHINLPNLFSDEERIYRDKKFYQAAETASRIILISETARNDFVRYLPRFTDKFRVIPAIVHIPDHIYSADPASMLDLYDIPARFIYMPNQFWKHKNHLAAFQSVKILKDRGINVTIICSGRHEDYRYPANFEELFQKVSDWDIKDQIIYLGMIPYEHVLLLMRQSLCLLNPSFFEGFGMTVSEAKSLGKIAFLSDIPAHREQSPEGAVFFNPSDTEELAGKMAKIWQICKPGPDIDLERKAKAVLPARINECARSFQSVIEEAREPLW